MAKVIRVTTLPEVKTRKVGKEQTATLIAVVLTVSFVVMLGLPLLLFTRADPVTVAPTVIDLIKTFASVFSGLVGAVIGYYFRSTGAPQEPTG